MMRAAAARLAVRPRRMAPFEADEDDRRRMPPAFSAAARACAIKGLARSLRVFRMRAGRIRRSSSRVIAGLLARCVKPSLPNEKPRAAK
jgi:hypothetical protein